MQAKIGITRKNTNKSIAKSEKSVKSKSSGKKSNKDDTENEDHIGEPSSNTIFK